jgi:hypothetical protein
MDKCVNGWSMNLWMNECHINFTSFNKYVFKICFQCTILVCEMYKLWLKFFYTISIIKSRDAEFMMYIFSDKGHFLLPWIMTLHKKRATPFSFWVDI